MPRRTRVTATVLAFAALGALLGWWFFSGAGQTATIRHIDDGHASIEWRNPNGSTRTAEVELPDPSYSVGQEVNITVDPEGGASLAQPAGPERTVATAVGGVVGALLGGVVVASLAGFGFVRGTGRAGESTSEDVREERGFYWRG